MKDEEWTEIDSVHGWLFRQEAEFLASLCVSPWCEVGAWKGRATRVMAKSGHGYVVDWFKGSSEHSQNGSIDTRAEFDANVTGLNITTIADDYRHAYRLIPDDIRFLYLDAEHTYENTKEAFRLYTPCLADDGIVVIHDAWGEVGERAGTPWPGVTQFVLELIDDGEWDNFANKQRCAAFRRI